MKVATTDTFGWQERRIRLTADERAVLEWAAEIAAAARVALATVVADPESDDFDTALSEIVGGIATFLDEPIIEAHHAWEGASR